ncbi:MAG: hypothetical protein CMF80_06020 [Candidatus Marinimicrobia bacterium]|nr:hypothetical protein [Candidatus Neomarinimicrobiota bacterium]|tara:strand:- start:886 stop:1311 length:426 start_codon:yes stop_codon:yes gene_type:complete
MILPEEIIFQNIMPYAYCPQSPELIKDIRTYSFILNSVIEKYRECYSVHTEEVINLIIQFDALTYYEKFTNKYDESSLLPFIETMDEFEYNRRNTNKQGNRLFRIILGKLKPIDRLNMLLYMIYSLESRDYEEPNETYYDD